jgi:phospholipase/carboxylesterase
VRPLSPALLGALIVAGMLPAASASGESPSHLDPRLLTGTRNVGATSCAPGEHRLRLGGGRTALMRVTAGGRRGRKALILVLHGAGGGSRGGLWAFRGGLPEPGVVMLAPASTGPTWSAVYGTDVDLAHVNRALARTFARCRIDRGRTAVGGFSDGATYALSLGLTNGDLFRAVIALSPGGAHAERTTGRPRVFIAHGTHDAVLPIARTSDVIVRKLRLQGYTVTYRRFKGGHEAPEEISRAAVRWFLRG